MVVTDKPTSSRETTIAAVSLMAESDGVFWQLAVDEVWSEAEAGGGMTRSENARCELAKQIEEHLGDGVPMIDSVLYRDLLREALARINAVVIADQWLGGCEGYESYCHHELTERFPARG